MISGCAPSVRIILTACLVTGFKSIKLYKSPRSNRIIVILLLYLHEVSYIHKLKLLKNFFMKQSLIEVICNSSYSKGNRSTQNVIGPLVISEQFDRFSTKWLSSVLFFFWFLEVDHHCKSWYSTKCRNQAEISSWNLWNHFSSISLFCFVFLTVTVVGALTWKKNRIEYYILFWVTHTIACNIQF